MATEPTGGDAEQAQKLAEAWGGVPRDPIETYHKRLRAVRNDVCQTLNRGTRGAAFSKEVTGTDLECMQKMCCGILLRMMELVRGAPRGGLASILGVHTTRLAAVIERKHWPRSVEASPRDWLRDGTLWILLGSNWRREMAWYQSVADRGSKRKQATLEGEERVRFLAVRCCWDIIEYFFPVPGNEAQPYFYANRKDWNAPYDRREVGTVIEWTRRQLLAYNDADFAAGKPRGVIAFFVPNLDIAERLLDPEYLRPQIALAGLQLSQLTIRVFLACAESSKADKLRSSIVALAEQQERDTKYWRDLSRRLASTDDIVKFHFSSTEQADDRGLLAMMFLGYFVMRGREKMRREHLFICRPYLDGLNRETPFCVRLTSAETQVFVSNESARHKNFKPVIDSFRAATSAPLAQDEDI